MASYLRCLRNHPWLVLSLCDLDDLVNVSQHVTSQTKQQTRFHGIEEILSGRLLSDLDNGGVWMEFFAVARDLLTKSLSTSCHTISPADLRQPSP